MRRQLPAIGITMDVRSGVYSLSEHYITAIRAAGGRPIPLLPHAHQDPLLDFADLDAIVLTGGRDPDTRAYGEPVHPMASLVDPLRQTHEERLLQHLEEEAPDLPVLGICFGMQMMGLRAKGRLEQHLPDVLSDPEIHAQDHVHRVSGLLGEGLVTSSHHQALKDAGGLQVVSRAEDGVIEGVFAPDRRFYLGVQWHPERTKDRMLGIALFERLIAAARGEDVDPLP